MHEADLPDQMEQLQDLARQFESLATRVRNLSVAPGSAALQQIGPLIPTAQDLVLKVVLRVSAFDGSEFTAATSSQITLDTLSTKVGTASQASYELARALALNPLTVAVTDPANTTAETVRRRRQEAARPAMAEHLHNAAALLDRCAASCRTVAARLAPKPNRAASSTTAQKEHPRLLSPAEAEALMALVKGGATLDTRGTHPISVHTPDNNRITMPTYQSLVSRRLVNVDNSGPVYRKRDIAVSAEGHRALAHHRTMPNCVLPPEVPSQAVPRGRS